MKSQIYLELTLKNPLLNKKKLQPVIILIYLTINWIFIIVIFMIINKKY